MGDSDSDGVDDELEEESERAIVGSEAGTAFELRSRSTQYQQNDEFRLSFDRGRLEFVYARVAQSLETELELRLEFEQLLAFADTDANGLYDDGEPVGELLELEHVEWAASTVQEVANPDGSLALRFEAATADGVFALTALASPHFYLAEGSIQPPTTVKLTFQIHGFPGGGEGDHVALIAEVSGDGATLAYSPDQNRLSAIAGEVSANFSWAPHATVDGEQTPVGAEYIPGILVLTYVGGEAILHDPLLEVESLAAFSGLATALALDPLVFGLSVAAAAGLIIILAVRHRHLQREL